LTNSQSRIPQSRINNHQIMSATYTIKLPIFEGPFDLLLFFVERDELDIYNIPIAKITNDFLAYIRQMEALNVDLASEFILVAATLIRIKSKMLLPRKPIDAQGEAIDPREELVQLLVEYRRYKSVLEELRGMEEARSLQYTRGDIAQDLKKIASKAFAEAEIESISLFKLLKTFEKVMLRFEDNEKRNTVHQVFDYEYTIQGQQQYIFDQLKLAQKVNFTTIFEKCVHRIHAIVTFLALLELLNLQQLQLEQGEGMNNFWLM
jgi:segregation and condensation protein A